MKMYYCDCCQQMLTEADFPEPADTSGNPDPSLTEEEPQSIINLRLCNECLQEMGLDSDAAGFNFPARIH